MSLDLHDATIDIPLGTITALHSSSSANAPRVLALHGWLDNAASFVPMARHLDGIELVAIDLPGHGHSVHLPPGAIYTFEMAVHHVLDVADALGWERFNLLGHSMGAGIASLVAASCPQRVERLVCIEALGGLADSAENTAVRMRESVAAMRALDAKSLRVFPQLDVAIQARMRANAMSEPVARLIVERGVRAVDGGWQWSSDPRLMVPTWIRPVDAQVVAVCGGIESPTRVVFADPAQPYLPDDVRRRYVDAVPNGELLVLPGTHHLHMETPQPVAEWVGSFLSG
ncbi:alpha/beta fold hydrolase [Solilutibacter silvestris]|uniref:Alpha/beta hydrolase family n=1 Tax=Solilutibacter silvestris TaxID=1645665 RepID=A0A2K1Q0S5_9GAMM|nr:alpha/beta fold hydrolase [Lysobacter silvestris]PNS08641.1 Alpha/beta hydrolase family [Lysobacter silvestris]